VQAWQVMLRFPRDVLQGWFWLRPRAQAAFRQLRIATGQLEPIAGSFTPTTLSIASFTPTTTTMASEAPPPPTLPAPSTLVDADATPKPVKRSWR
jgi:hypothetical protein